VPEAVAVRVSDYLWVASQPPAWLDESKLARAERVFVEHGARTMTLLSCASLPKTYVIPDLAAVLRTTGQLERRTEDRIRATGSTLFPLMQRGGLCAADGGAVAQLLKTRLTHAMIRHLILRGDPARAVAQALDQGVPRRAAAIPVSTVAPVAGVHLAGLACAGWALGEDGLPCNQEQMAYTLLTFGYVYLRSLRKLGLALSPEDEEAYLHLWNVAGHYLGIDHALLAPDMGQAAERAMKPSILHQMPVMTTRYLCGRETSADLALAHNGGRLLYPLFLVAVAILRGVDRVGAVLRPGFSLARFLCRLMGYRFMSRLVAPAPIAAKSAPVVVRQQFLAAMSAWSVDPHAGAWLNALEQRLRGADSVN